MSYIQAIILSIVEGITEFLPISSTGHLILVTKLLGIFESDFVKTFEIVIQLGAILSVVYLYRKILLKNIKIWKTILVAFVPTGVIGFLFYKFVKNYLLGNSSVVTISLIIGGIILILFEFFVKTDKNNVDKLEKVSYKNAFLIGVFQSISIIPGVSRAAATIVGGLFLGLDRETAVEFSFLLAIPTMFAASALDLFKSMHVLRGGNLGLLVVGTFVAFVTALLTVKFFVNFIKKNNFIWF